MNKALCVPSRWQGVKDKVAEMKSHTRSNEKDIAKGTLGKLWRQTMGLKFSQLCLAFGSFHN
jgi:hypothetical protein